jgi:hypothetical protein
MQILDRTEGVLQVLVSSQGNSICEGTSVVIEIVVDNFKNIAVRVKSASKTVFLPFYGNDVDWLLQKNNRF